MPETKATLSYEEIIALRKEGYSYNRIASRAGVSRQRIYQIVQSGSEALFAEDSQNDAYTGLHNFMIDNGYNYDTLAKAVGMRGTVFRIKSQKLSLFTTNEIWNILNFTELSFDQCFNEYTDGLFEVDYVISNDSSIYRNPVTVIYKGLYNFMKEHHHSYGSFSNNIGLLEPAFRKKALGENPFYINEIKKILALTKLSFEECFERMSNEEIENLV